MNFNKLKRKFVYLHLACNFALNLHHETFCTFHNGVLFTVSAQISNQHRWDCCRVSPPIPARCQLFGAETRFWILRTFLQRSQAVWALRPVQVKSGRPIETNSVGQGPWWRGRTAACLKKWASRTFTCYLERKAFQTEHGTHTFIPKQLDVERQDPHNTFCFRLNKSSKVLKTTREKTWCLRIYCAITSLPSR